MHLLIPYASALSDSAVHVLRDLSLPTLERLLAVLTPQPVQQGDESSLSPPHERALAQAWGWQGQDGAWPFAARAAAADGIDVGDAAWGLVTPVHWHVGRDHVLLDDPASLDLTEEESRSLFEAVRELFASAGLRFEWGAALRWYAAHDSLDKLACASLDRVIARPIEPWLRPDPEAQDSSRLVRRLQSEFQMLLYAHPINEAREERGVVPVNSFWLSGCGRLQPSAQSDPQVIDALRAPLLAEDWIAWSQAWNALDGDELRQTLEAALAGEPVSLTLCGERSHQRFDSAPRSLWRRVSGAWRRTEARQVLEAL